MLDVDDYANDARVGRAFPGSCGGAVTGYDLIQAFSNHDDADHNGFVDDIAGWDFLDNDNDPYDDVQYGHGTGEASDSSSEANNGGQAGSCPNCMVVPLRVGDSFVADANRFGQAALYAVDNGVLVIQEALGTLNNTHLAREAIDYAYNHGVAVIASAADEAAQHHNYVSSLPHTIVVNSADQYDQTFSPQPRSYLQFNGCTNFSSKVTIAVPSSSCSSNATGLGAGMAGLVYSAALDAVQAGRLAASATCSRTISPIRRMPSRISSSGTPAKFKRIEQAPRRPSMYAARPGTNATPSLLRACASRSVVSIRASSVAQMNSPPWGCVQRACSPKCRSSASSITSRRRR